MIAHRLIERQRLARHLHDAARVFQRQAGGGGRLFHARLAAVLLHQVAGHGSHPGHGVDHVHRHADRAALVGDRPGDRLANPPGGVRRELVAAGVLELVDRPHQPGVAFLDQVQEAQAAVAIALGDRDDQPQVAGRQLALGGVVRGLQARPSGGCGGSSVAGTFGRDPHQVVQFAAQLVALPAMTRRGRQLRPVGGRMADIRCGDFAPAFPAAARAAAVRRFNSSTAAPRGCGDAPAGARRACRSGKRILLVDGEMEVALVLAQQLDAAWPGSDRAGAGFASFPAVLVTETSIVRSSRSSPSRTFSNSLTAPCSTKSLASMLWRKRVRVRSIGARRGQLFGRARAAESRPSASDTSAPDRRCTRSNRRRFRRSLPRPPCRRPPASSDSASASSSSNALSFSSIGSLRRPAARLRSPRLIGIGAWRPCTLRAASLGRAAGGRVEDGCTDDVLADRGFRTFLAKGSLLGVRQSCSSAGSLAAGIEKQIGCQAAGEVGAHRSSLDATKELRNATADNRRPSSGPNVCASSIPCCREMWCFGSSREFSAIRRQTVRHVPLAACSSNPYVRERARRTIAKQRCMFFPSSIAGGEDTF